MKAFERYNSILMLILLCSTMLSATAQVEIPSNVPRRGLIAYYGFNGNADDMTGRGNNGILETGGSTQAVLTSDRFGQANRAYKFGGIDNPNWIRVPNSDSLQFNTELTISCWVQMCSFYGHAGSLDSIDENGNFSYRTVQDNSYNTLIAKAGDGHNIEGFTNAYTNEAGWQLSISPKSDHTMYLDFSNGDGDRYDNNCNVNFSQTYSCYDSCEWVHIAIVINNNKSTCYINGTLYGYIELINTVNFLTANNKDLYIGRMANASLNKYPFNGSLDDIAIYNVALTDEEVDSLYNNYISNLNVENLISVDSVIIKNPCGNTAGTISIYPAPGGVYKYSLDSPNAPQENNTFSCPPGTYRIYTITDCGLWDSVVTLQCDCSDDPSLVKHEQVCPNTSGQQGSIETIYSYGFETRGNGWQYGNNWQVNYYDDNYWETGSYSWGHSQQSGNNSAFCPTYHGYIAYSTNNLISPAININNDPSKVTISFYYFAEMIDDMNIGQRGYNTLKLYYSKTASGPWTQLWKSNGNDVMNWTPVNVSLSSLPDQGTYYFKFEMSGDGYNGGVDNLVIKSDTRWNIPNEVTRGAEGSTVRTEVVQDNTGTCPVSEVTFWYIIPTHGTATGTDADTTACDSAYWWNAWRYESMDYVSQHKTKVLTTKGTACDSTVSHHLTVYKSDKVNVIDTTVCDSYTWPATEQEYTESTDLFVSGLNKYGCQSNDSLHLIVHYSFDSTINDSIKEEDLPYITFTGEEIDEELRNHTYHYTTIDGCDSNYYLNLKIIIKKYDCDLYLQFPNTVTPNGDGVNDFFRIIGINRDCYQHNQITIYNRWGARVYKANDIEGDNIDWDASKMPAGTYFFHFVGIGAIGTVERNGTIEVIKH